MGDILHISKLHKEYEDKFSMEWVSQSDTSEKEFKFKVVLLGEGAVGKSSLMLRYVENKFSPRHISTIQASFLSKHIEIDNCHVELNIWDTAGQEKYHALGPIYYRGSNGALLIYDITDQRSFDKVKVWIRELQRALGDSVVLVVVGNKLDLEKQRTVDKEMAQQYATEVGAQYLETSAKENIGLSDLFEKISSLMIARSHELTASQPATGTHRRGRRNIQLVDDTHNERREAKCCK